MKFISLDNLKLFYNLIKDKLSGKSVAGALPMTVASTVDTLKEKALSMEEGDIVFYLMRDSLGSSTSPSITFESSVAEFISQSPYIVVGSTWVGTGTKTSSLGASNGDILAVIKTKMASVTTYVFKVVPVNDAKSANGDFPGCDGLESIWDKTQISKIPTLVSNVNNLNNGRSYDVRDEKNIDKALNPGIYPNCTSGRSMSGNHDDETYTVVVESSYNNNTSLWNVRQWAYSDNYHCRAFYRFVQTDTLTNYNGTYSEWKQIGDESNGERTFYWKSSYDSIPSDSELAGELFDFVEKYVAKKDSTVVSGFRGIIQYGLSDTFIFQAVKDSKTYDNFYYAVGLLNNDLVYVQPNTISEGHIVTHLTEGYTLQGSALKEKSVTTEALANNVVTSAKIAKGSVSYPQIDSTIVSGMEHYVIHDITAPSDYKVFAATLIAEALYIHFYELNNKSVRYLPYADAGSYPVYSTDTSALGGVNVKLPTPFKISLNTGDTTYVALVAEGVAIPPNIGTASSLGKCTIKCHVTGYSVEGPASYGEYKMEFVLDTPSEVVTTEV